MIRKDIGELMLHTKNEFDSLSRSSGREEIPNFQRGLRIANRGWIRRCLSILHRQSSIIAFSITFLATTVVTAATLSNPQVDAYNVRVGTETFAGMYGPFTTNTLLVETAEAMTNMGSDIIKLYLGSNASGQEGITLTSNITNL